ncbi:MAG: hypothetical protein V4858_17230 [Pseudomonadota bacterium]
MAQDLGFASNPYLDKTIADSLGDTTRAYNMTQAPAYTSAMVRSGSFGNSGALQMQQEAERQLQTSLGRQANDMRTNNYQFDQNFDRQVYNDQFGQNQQNIQTGMGLIGMQNQFNQQDLGFGKQIQNTPLDYYQGFANTSNSFGQGYGTSTGNTSQTGGGSNPWVQALGGAQLGSSLMGGWGSGTNSAGNTPYNGTSGGWVGTPQQSYFYGNGSSGD